MGSRATAGRPNPPGDRHMRPRSRGAMRPRFASVHPPRERRAQGKPGADCTRGRAHKKRTRDHRFNRIIPAFPARWVTAYFVISSVTGLFATVAVRNTTHLEPGRASASPQDLTPASGRRNHTTSPSATVSAERSTGRRAAGKVLAKMGCSAVRPRLGRSLKALSNFPAKPIARRRCRVHRISTRVHDDARSAPPWVRQAESSH